MRLFANDLYRNFAIGFLLAAIGVGVANAGPLGDEIAPPAHAADATTLPLPASEFLIAPMAGETD
jgi:hypothetical protein